MIGSQEKYYGGLGGIGGYPAGLWSLAPLKTNHSLLKNVSVLCEN